MDTFYLGIGAPRSGTTWLYHNLRDASDLYLPPIKELRYFAGNRSVEQKQQQAAEWLGKPPTDPRDTEFLQAWSQTNDGDHDTYLDQFPSEGKVGEISPIYCTMSQKNVQLIKGMLGDRPTKVFFLMRNPYFRDVSHIIFTMHRQRKRSNPYTAAEYNEFITALRFRQRSNYARTMAVWGNVFGEDFHPFYYDHLDAEPAKFYEDFATKMDLKGEIKKVDESKKNQSGHQTRFQIQLPPEVLGLLRRRSLRRVAKMQFLPDTIRENWLQEIKAVKINPGKSSKKKKAPKKAGQAKKPA